LFSGNQGRDHHSTFTEDQIGRPVHANLKGEKGCRGSQENEAGEKNIREFGKREQWFRAKRIGTQGKAPKRP